MALPLLEQVDVMDDVTMAVLELGWKLDCEEDLFWRVDDGRVKWYVNCNDFFYWGCADLEPIESMEDVALFRQTYEDVKALGEHLDGNQAGPLMGGWWWPLLYCARHRGMRPQRPYFKGHWEPNPNNGKYPDHPEPYPDVFRMHGPYEVDGLSPEARALFDAAGPERDPKEEG